MPGYIIKVLQHFQYLIPRRKQHAPHKWTELVYGTKRQNAIIRDEDQVLSPADTKIV